MIIQYISHSRPLLLCFLSLQSFVRYSWANLFKSENYFTYFICAKFDFRFDVILFDCFILLCRPSVREKYSHNVCSFFWIFQLLWLIFCANFDLRFDVVLFDCFSMLCKISVLYLYNCSWYSIEQAWEGVKCTSWQVYFPSWWTKRWVILLVWGDLFALS